MENSKTINAFSYLSIFFAPILAPIIVYFVMKDKDVRHHAKRALWSHLLPFILGIVLFAVALITTFYMNELSDSFIIFYYISLIICIVVYTGVTIWNIIQAVKIMR